uniref:Uncharacterized protein n=1 Tax=Trypanosoma vivax (strain Y486) TaxID=1055687 RepID=G0U7B5_TRYVY|nr:hypothetical protein TVY486_1008190 [Trypanosoma vivax Y486]
MAIVDALLCNVSYSLKLVNFRGIHNCYCMCHIDTSYFYFRLFNSKSPQTKQINKCSKKIRDETTINKQQQQKKKKKTIYILKRWRKLCMFEIFHAHTQFKCIFVLY